MGLEEGSPCDKDHQSRHDGAEDSHQLGGGHAEGNDHSDHAHHHNSLVEEGSYHGIRHVEGCIREVGRDDHSRPGTFYERENGIYLDHEVSQVGSTL